MTVEAKTQGYGANAHAVLSRDGNVIGTVKMSDIDILSPEVREMVLAKMAPGAEEKAK